MLHDVTGGYDVVLQGLVTLPAVSAVAVLRRCVVARDWGAASKGMWPMYGKLAPALVLVVMAATMTRPILLLAQDESCAASDADLAIDVEEQAAIDEINRLREAAGLSALMVSESLTRAAAWKARAMADGAPFEHADPFRSFDERLTDCGVSAEPAVENLAKGVATGSEVAQFWYNDPTHWQPLLDPLAQWIGIARTVDARGSVYWCAVFSS